MGGVTVLHGVPFLIGGTDNTAAIRALAEIEHWVSITSVGTDEISATRKAFMDSLRTSTSTLDIQQIIRLPVSQTSQEKTTFVTTGFNNLKTAVEPISEEEEKSLLVLMLDELNNLYPVNLCTDVICDRFTDEEVFDNDTKDRTDLVLIGASHLAKTVRCLNSDLWNVIDLTLPGLRINSQSVNEILEKVKEVATQIDIEKATVILQLFDNSVYMVGGPGGEKRLPGRDRLGTYHIDGSLAVADKAVIKDLVGQLTPVLKALGGSRKIILSPLARYWVAPCCGDPLHLVNYRTTGYLPKLGDAIAALRDHVRDALFVKKIPNFRVLCPNKMVGVGKTKHETTDEEAAKTAAVWGPDPVHPTSAAYRLIAEALEADIENPDARYTNPGKATSLFKKPRYDPSLHRDGWVAGCSAALPRRDSGQISPAQRGSGRTPHFRGRQGRYGGRSLGGRSSGGFTRGAIRGGGYRTFHGGRRTSL
jgi:lysophospholipase L1-like esterase